MEKIKILPLDYHKRAPTAGHAIIYARFSPRRDAELCESLETQVDKCQEFCKQQDYIVQGIYTDAAMSGDDEDRPGLEQATQAIKKGWVLVAHKIDRLARSVCLTEMLYRKINKRKGRIEVVEGSPNGSTPQDVMQRQMLAAFYEFEKKIIGARTSAAHLAHQARGRSISSKTPYGTKLGKPIKIQAHGRIVTRNMLAVNHIEMAIVERILIDWRAGMGLRAIARQLLKEKIPCRDGCYLWHQETINNIIKRYNDKDLTMLDSWPPKTVEQVAARRS